LISADVREAESQPNPSFAMRTLAALRTKREYGAGSVRDSSAYVLSSHRKLETVMEKARTQDGHQNVIVSDARNFIHFVEIIEQVQNFW